jgi:hypothetical protein
MKVLGRESAPSLWPALPTLRALIGPIPPEEFFSSHLESRYLHVARDHPTCFEHLVTLEDVDRILTTHNLRYPQVVVAESGELVPPQHFVRDDDSVDASRLLGLYADGATIVLNRLHDFHTPLAEFCAALEPEFGAPVQANCYLTPPLGRGFRAHFDSHDVFLLQIYGAKRWRLGAGPIDLPLSAQARDLAKDEPIPIGDEITVAAGDTLYIPRGIAHWGEAGPGRSLHLTIGVASSRTWANLIQEVLADLILNDVDFRRTIPPIASPLALKPKFDELVGKLTTRGNIQAALTALRDDFLRERRPVLRGQLLQIEALADVKLDSFISPRPNLAFILRDEPSAVVIVCHGKEIRIPQFGAAAVRFVLTVTKCQVADLPDPLDDASKVMLVRRLIREGLVMTVSSAYAVG